MSLDANWLDTWAHARWERYCQLSAAALIGYEYLLQFDNEVKFFWKKRWSVGKGLFIWSRYYSLGFCIANAAVYLYDSPSLKVCTYKAIIIFTRLIEDNPMLYLYPFFSLAKHWGHITNSYDTCTVILELRLYAMYQGSKFIITTLLFLILGEAVAMIVIIGTNKPGTGTSDFHSITNEPIHGLFICADGDPPGQHWISYYFTTILIVETSLLVLSLWKSWQHYRSGSRVGIMNLLTRDSVVYFVAMFGVYVLVQIIWLMNMITMNELATGISYALGAVLANRLMINIRASYYGDEDPDIIELDFPREPSQVRFRRRREVVTRGILSNIELKTLDLGEGF